MDPFPTRFINKTVYYRSQYTRVYGNTAADACQVSPFLSVCFSLCTERLFQIWISRRSYCADSNSTRPPTTNQERGIRFNIRMDQSATRRRKQLSLSTNQRAALLLVFVQARRDGKHEVNKQVKNILRNQARKWTRNPNRNSNCRIIHRRYNSASITMKKSKHWITSLELQRVKGT